ncbi:MAG TPA: hypothetical protein PK184_00160 [Phycisphaerae bacterium]|jgi:hypothetical protein|nr:hypothetical protein [Phycisphaerae bacterium]
MKAFFLDEPELEFGSGARHIDVRFGLTLNGALDRHLESAPRVVRIGMVGPAANVDNARAWIDHCRHGVEGKDTHRTRLFPGFPGFGDGKPLCNFVVDDRLVDTISSRDSRRIADAATGEAFFAASSARYLEGARDLMEKANADVVVCLLPDEFVKRIDVPDGETAGPRSARRMQTQERFIWHDAFKAHTLKLARPVQVCRPATYGGGVHRYTRDGRATKDTQDEATRAWNFFCALYYKAGGVPWRLLRTPSDLSTCFAGISFYHDPASESMRTSVAQIFNERGEGVIVRGGPAELDEKDKTPHLNQANATELLLKLLAVYKREHRNTPARLVCHKSSYFNAAELAGCKMAADELEIDSYDLLSMRRSRTRLYRAGAYPPLRGTAVTYDGGALLYTNGSVDFYQCYPGLYTPRTLDVRFDRIEQGHKALLEEILGLTKMNWNSTEMATFEPVTLDAARGVGSILRYASRDDLSLQSRFSFFM